MPSTGTESWYQDVPRPIPRWERTNGGWIEGKCHLTTYKQGQPVALAPFDNLPAVYCEFVEYIGEDEQFAIIDIPGGEHKWFDSGPGKYIVRERYLTPQ